MHVQIGLNQSPKERRTDGINMVDPIVTDEDHIKDLVDWFFQKINIPIVESAYINDLQNWDALCSSLTIINDLQRPKSEYYALQKVNHLEAIGIMQALYIEQDCMLTLKNAIQKSKDTAALSDYKPIRELRNEAFGHPSAKGRKTDTFSRHFFDIVDEDKQILKIINWENTGDIISDRFILSEKVKLNSGITRKYLEELKSTLIDNISKQMDNYKIKVNELFNHMGYVFEKLLTKENDSLAIRSYESSVDDEITRAKEALIERGVFDDDFKRQIDVAEFFSSKLKPLFYKQTKLDTEFYAYASTLRQKLSDLKKSIKDLEDVF